MRDVWEFLGIIAKASVVGTCDAVWFRLLRRRLGIASLYDNQMVLEVEAMHSSNPFGH